MNAVTISTLPLALAFSATVAIADDLHVPRDHATIQEAINAAEDGDVIHIAAGEHVADSLDPLGKDIHLIGVENQTVLRPSTAGRILYVHSGEGPLTRFESLTFTGMNSDDTAVRLTNVDVSFINCTFSDNTAHPYNGGGYDSPGNGAAVEGYGGSPNFHGCHFQSNTSVGDDHVPAPGGAIWFKSGSPEFVECTFGNNSCERLHDVGAAGRGGAIYLNMCNDVVLQECQFQGNKVVPDDWGGSGGALYLWHVTGSIEACSFVGNQTTDDSAVSSRGGAIYAGHSEITIDGSQFNENAASAGSAIYLQYDPAEIQESSFCGHLGEEIEGEWTDGGGNSFADECLCEGDLSGDGAVGIADLLIVIDLWGACAGCEADMTGDGVVGVGDLLIVLDGWGACP